MTALEANNNSNHHRILFALPTLGHPRHAKRISMMKEAGFDVEAVAFKRPYHAGRMPNCPVVTLESISHGNYVKRAFKIIKALPKLRNAIKKHDLVFAFGPDMAVACLVANFFLRKKLVFEVGDIMRPQLAPGLKGWVVRKIDRYVADKASVIVATSPRFLDEYYSKWVKTKTPGLLIENKLERAFCEKMELELSQTAPSPGTPLQDRPLKIGYFGFLRNQWSLEVLERLVVKYPNKFEIVIAGRPTESTKNTLDRVARLENIDYRDEYRSPDDLPELFRSIDMVWACYHPFRNDEWGFRWARPNRFYQGCLFRKPFFSRAGCQDAIFIAEHNIGKIVSEVGIDETADSVASLTASDIKAWTSNMQKVPYNVFAYTTEVAELKSTIEKILAS